MSALAIQPLPETSLAERAIAAALQGLSDSWHVRDFDATGKHTFGRVQQGETAIAYRQRARSGFGQSYTSTAVFITDAAVKEPPKVKPAVSE
jgi:hypothetical protein